MIALQKTEQPAILRDNAESWRQELCDVLAAGGAPTKTQRTRYNQPEVKAALVAETRGKCAYCESKIRHIDDGDIEHIEPKSIVPESTFNWNNLTLACTVCNRNKGDYYGVPGSAEELINPYNDQPSDHFLFHREILTPSPDSIRALRTEETISLNRAELVERRREKMAELHGLVVAFAQAEAAYKPMVIRQIKRRYLDNSHEYSAFTRRFVEEMVDRGVLPAEVLD